MGVQTPYSENLPFPPINLSPLNSYAGSFAGVVINESWSQLEPSNGVYDWAPLDQSLANVQIWNSDHPNSPLAVKLRIFAGHGAPSWVVSESGPTVAIEVHGVVEGVGQWWTTPFRDAWSTFQHALAARYDSNPLIREVSVSSCTSSTGEPFVISGAIVSRRNLAAAGWTIALQEQCLSQALADYSGWHQTLLTFAFNPLPTQQGPDQAFTNQIMLQCVDSYKSGGPKCAVGNNDVSANASLSASGPTYSEITTLTANPSNDTQVYFQTTPLLTCSTIYTALKYHASSVEVWSPNGRYRGFSAFSPSTLSLWNKALAGGSSLGC